MFGLSFWKVVVLVAVIAIVWFGFAWLKRIEKERQDRHSARAAPRPWHKRDGAGDVTAEDMTACRVCGTYVAIHLAKPCGRGNCPYG